MPRRNGTSLVEVLVAIFVMGIGLLAILALFPIGAYRMSQAIQDDRMANISLSSDATATVWNVRRDAAVLPCYQNPPGTALQASAGNPSFPVVVDPIGYRTFGGSTTVGGTNVSAGAGISWIPRSTLTFNGAYAVPPGPTDYACLRWFAALDDINFDTVNLNYAGRPYLLAGTSTFERDIRYSWAYVCQMPNISDASVINLTTLAFNRRTLSLSNNPLLLPFEYSYSATFNPNNNMVTVQYNATLPPVRAGEWIMDASPVVNSTGSTVSAHAYFYRVVAINDLGGSVEYEVQTPLRGWPRPFVDGAGPPYAGNVIVFEGLAEVFEHGPGRGQ